MSNTYTQIHIQCVFAVKFRKALIHRSWKERPHQYIIRIIQNHGHKVLSINSMPDHLHLFIGLRPTQSLSDLMRIVKGESSEWINKERFTPIPFNLQSGFGAFSYSRSHISAVCRYIEQQEKHHAKKNLQTELLKRFEVDYDDRFLFKDPQ